MHRLSCSLNSVEGLYKIEEYMGVFEGQLKGILGI